MRTFQAVLAASVLIAGQAAAQTVYAPTAIEFESADHARVTVYRVELLPDTGTTPLLTVDVPVASVTVLPGALYRIPFSVLPGLPTGRSYRVQVRSVGGTDVSDPSAIAPQTVRFSPCVAGAGVAPMSITVGTVPALKAGQMALLPLTIAAPQAVYSVTVDLASDGQPGWLFQSATDWRGTHLFAIGPFARPVSSLLTLAAVDASGCGTSVTSALVTVR